MVGILIITLLKAEFLIYNILSAEFHFQMNELVIHVIRLQEKLKLTASSLFYLLPFCFFIGELISGLSEFFIFDPMFFNVRSDNNKFMLEYSDLEFRFTFQKSKMKILIDLVLLLIMFIFPIAFKFIRSFFQDNFISNNCISIFKFNNFIEQKERTFSLSEMYFNMHRILGGCAILFWLLFIFWLLSIKVSQYGLYYNVGLGVINYILMIFCIIQAKNQRKFANKLIYFS